MDSSRTKLDKIRALIDRGATEGERQAAREALCRIGKKEPERSSDSFHFATFFFRSGFVVHTHHNWVPGPEFGEFEKVDSWQT